MIGKILNRGLLIMSLGLVMCCTRQPAPNYPEPSVGVMSESVDWNSAVLTAVLNNPEGIVECGFWLSAPGSDPVKVPVSIVQGSISYEWSGLKASTEYAWWVYYTNGKDEVEVPGRSFTTDRQPYDSNLWHFLLKAYDTDGDHMLSSPETASVTEIELFDIPLESLSGLELLENLESLSLARNGLETIDLSPLKKLVFFSARQEPLVRTIIMNNLRLYSTYLDLDSPYVKSLDYTRCPDIGMVSWVGNSLESIDFSLSARMYFLSVSGSSLKEVDLSASSIFERIVSRNNPSLNAIWLRKGTSLTEIEVEPHTQILYK